MAENNEFNEIYLENDKRNCPFLLAASFQGLITFHGNIFKNGVLYWQFTPKDKALLLIEQFLTKTEPHIPSKDLIESVSAFWHQISKFKKQELRNT